MKIFSAKQLFQADQMTLKNQHITPIELMERAATRAFKILERKIKHAKPSIKVFCGIGNNGGDGLVIARKLIEQDHHVKVFIMEYSDSPSDEFRENLNRLEKLAAEQIFYIKGGDAFPNVYAQDVIIDAIFGIGLNRTLPSWINDLVAHINAIDNYVVAIDMPTGLFSDQIPGEGQGVLKADLTLTFQSPKFVFYLPQTSKWAGTIEVIDIGLDSQILKETLTDVQLVTGDLLKWTLHKRAKFSHKGTFGHAVIIGGSYGKMGSVVLATKAALRIGAGKVTSTIPKCGCTILQTSIPEAMVMTYGDGKFLNGFVDPGFIPEVVGFGIGAGTNKFTAEFFLEVLKARDNPMLIDADGINLLAKNKELLGWIPEKSVLTPHLKELKGLIGEWKDDFDKIEKVKTFSKKYKVVMVIKGAHTLTVENDKILINSTGNPGMATAGSGDVLTGIITGLMAQGYPSLKASVFGVYLHGLAGDLAVKKLSQEALIAGDLILNLAAAFQQLS